MSAVMKGHPISIATNWSQSADPGMSSGEADLNAVVWGL